MILIGIFEWSMRMSYTEKFLVLKAPPVSQLKHFSIQQDTYETFKSMLSQILVMISPHAFLPCALNI